LWPQNRGEYGKWIAMGFVNDAGIKVVAFLVIYRKRIPNMVG
jgi:hypothetical protein